MKWLTDFDFEGNPSINPAIIHTLAHRDWVRKGEPLCLVNELVEAADERKLSRTIARYGRIARLCIEELGYMELDRRGADMLFQVLTASVAIANNESFSGWTKSSPIHGSARTTTDPNQRARSVTRAPTACGPSLR